MQAHRFDEIIVLIKARIIIVFGKKQMVVFEGFDFVNTFLNIAFFIFMRPFLRNLSFTQGFVVVQYIEGHLIDGQHGTACDIQNNVKSV